MTETNEIDFKDDLSQNIFCPNDDCGGGVIVSSRDCGIFIHGIHKETKKQIDPHATKDQCEEWIKTNQIFGCGKPFFIDYNSKTKTFTVTKRDYEH